MKLLTELGPDNRSMQLWAHAEALRRGCRLQCGPYLWTLVKDQRIIRISPDQYAHTGELAAHFDGLFETIAPAISGRFQVLDFSRLRAHIHRASGASFELIQPPETDQQFESYLEEYRPNPKDLVFDLGAECGVSTYQLAKMAGHVIAFEPDPAFRGVLQRNIARNKLANVTVASKGMRFFSELAGIKGAPAFCRIHLDRIAPEFVLEGEDILLASAIVFAGRSKSSKVRLQFMKGLREVGFESAADKSLGFIWSRPVAY